MDEKTEKAILEIFFPFWADRKESIINRKGRFVHYTSAESALKIIQSKCLWMRNAKCMNDYSELLYGYHLLGRFFNERGPGNEFIKTVDNHKNGISKAAIIQYHDWWNGIQTNTFISAISEHDPAEDFHGRLSMWRAYGQNSAKAAIVFNLPFDNPNFLKGSNLILRPAAYFSEKELSDEIIQVITNIKNNAELISSWGMEIFQACVFLLLLLNTICLKHKGFLEEREWRVIHLPRHMANLPKHIIPKTIESKIEIVNGVPQNIYQMPLEEKAADSKVGTELNQVIDKVIIGPTQYPYPIFDAFVSELQKYGIKDAASRVIVSGIPLRT